MKWSKVMAGILSAVIVVTMVSGCNNAKKDPKVNNDLDTEVIADTNAVETGVAMGRYVEEEIELPEALVTGTIERTFQMVKNPEGKIELSCRLVDAEVGENGVIYTLKDDNTWERKLPNWLNQKDRGEWLATFYTYSPEGTRYALSMIQGQKEDIIIKSTDGEKTEKVTVNGSSQDLALRIKALSDDTIVLNCVPNCKVIRDGEVIAKFDHAKSICCAVYENLLMLPSKKGDGACIYDINTSEMVSEIPFPDSKKYLKFTELTVDKGGNWYMVADSGVYRLVKNGNTWEKLIDGTMTAMSDPAMECWDLVVGDKEDFYIMFGYSIKHYVYNKDIPTTPSETLTVLSLEDNTTVRKAITEFMDINPDVKIDFTVLMDEEIGLPSSDYIKTINTELLAGKGPDILILDNMPVDSYIEKGVLADLSDIINPFVEDGTISSNKIEGYKADGKIYYAPIRFSVLMACGRKEAVQSAASMESLAEYAKNTAKIPMLCDNFYTYSDLISLAFTQYLYSSNLLGADGLFKKDELLLFLEQLKLISDQTKAMDERHYDVGEEGMYSSVYISALFQEFAELMFIELNSMRDVYEPIVVLEATGGEWTTVNKGSFIPHGQLGINNASTKKELASEFIKLCYSQEIQEMALEDGFPINSKAMEVYGMERDDITGERKDLYVIKQPSVEKMQEIIDTCKSLNTPVNVDRMLLDIIMAEAKPYLKGEAELQETADRIMEKTKFYLSE